MNLRTKLLPDRRGKRFGRGEQNPCVICGREVDTTKARYVHLVEGGHLVLHPGDEHLYVPDGGDVGAHPIGPDCAKRLGMEWSA